MRFVLGIARSIKKRAGFFKRNAGLYIDHWLKRKEKKQSDELHLDACIQWILKAEQKEGGIAKAWSLQLGWLESYPETTGYIISTLIDFAEFKTEEAYLKKAIELGDWEIKIQLPEGAVRVSDPNSFMSDVFDTGMVILGFTSLYETTKQERFKLAAEKAANWLLQVQDSDGKWSSFSFKGIPHAYHSKIAWSLYKLYKQSGNPRYKKASEKNLDWIFSEKTSDNWFNFMGFSENEDPYTHTIAYTLQGFLEIYKLMGAVEKDARLFEVPKAVCDTLIFKYGLEKPGIDSPYLLPATLSSDWKKSSNYVCLTGNAQFSIVLLDLFQITSEKKYYISATNLIKTIKLTQKLNLQTDHPLYGAIGGSYPIWGDYHANEYPNWAPKFFADALIKKIRIDRMNTIN